MKPSVGTLAAIIALSLGVWMLFYTLTPETPLTPPETLVIVGACAAIVLLGRWIWSRLQPRRNQDRDQGEGLAYVS
ncbi:MAG: hypothetical protein ACE5NC_09190 [Anaerolineae bacterium]